MLKYRLVGRSVLFRLYSLASGLSYKQSSHEPTDKSQPSAGSTAGFQGAPRTACKHKQQTISLSTSLGSCGGDCGCGYAVHRFLKMQSRGSGARQPSGRNEASISLRSGSTDCNCNHVAINLPFDVGCGNRSWWGKHLHVHVLDS